MVVPSITPIDDKKSFFSILAVEQEQSKEGMFLCFVCAMYV
jgi:hypothetical protein